ncbi:endonuclease III [Candidatus Gottesmanbacteria bacterium]|nr:endonuclease III [Candidatus Gottesmanbacteria bacterium]
MESVATSKAIKIIEILKKTYPKAKIVLNYSNPWELLVSVILSAQCTDKQVNKVTDKLFRKYKTVRDYAKVPQSEFETDIRSTGFYKNKAGNIIATAKIILDKYHGKVPNTFGDLLTLRGVARKTANVVLGNAYKIYQGIAVDTHVLRISQRLRLVDLKTIGGRKKMMVGMLDTIDFLKDADPVKIEKQLMNIVPKKDWFKYTYLIIDHGRAICKSISPNCIKCPLSNLCPVSRTKLN